MVRPGRRPRIARRGSRIPQGRQRSLGASGDRRQGMEINRVNKKKETNMVRVLSRAPRRRLERGRSSRRCKLFATGNKLCKICDTTSIMMHEPERASLSLSLTRDFDTGISRYLPFVPRLMGRTTKSHSSGVVIFAEAQEERDRRARSRVSEC